MNITAIDQSGLVETFLKIAKLARVDLPSSDVRSELLRAPHKRPSALPENSQAVYAFLLDGHCLKVGKAGPKTQARFTSQHYGMNAPSTLAKSILNHRKPVAALLPRERRHEVDALDQESIGVWMERNTTRLHVFLPTRVGGLALSLLEAFIQCRLKPLFEGKVV